jgi:hypothetical protein
LNHPYTEYYSVVPNLSPELTGFPLNVDALAETALINPLLEQSFYGYGLQLRQNGLYSSSVSKNDPDPNLKTGLWN